MIKKYSESIEDCWKITNVRTEAEIQEVKSQRSYLTWPKSSKERDNKIF